MPRCISGFLVTSRASSCSTPCRAPRRSLWRVASTWPSSVTWSPRRVVPFPAGARASWFHPASLRPQRHRTLLPRVRQRDRRPLGSLILPPLSPPPRTHPYTRRHDGPNPPHLDAARRRGGLARGV